MSTVLYRYLVTRSDGECFDVEAPNYFDAAQDSISLLFPSEPGVFVHRASGAAGQPGWFAAWRWRKVAGTAQRQPFGQPFYIQEQGPVPTRRL